MRLLISTLIAGITAFVVTNIDDIIVLMMFFSQVNSSFRAIHIVIGQYLGFVVLLLACLPGFIGGLALPESLIGLLGFLPIVIGIQQLLAQNDTDITIATVVDNGDIIHSKLPPWLHPNVYQVAAVTIANGGDNIGVYVPLFAGSNLPSLIVIICVFLILVAAWCAIAYYCTRHPAIAPLLTRYTHRMVPFVLIGLGVYILWENGSYRLIPRF